MKTKKAISPVPRQKAAFILSFVILSSLVFLQCSLPTGGFGRIVDDEVVGAVLNEDWQGVVDILEPKIDELSPVNSFILGHAYIALNHNNDSLCMFLSSSEGNGLSKWNGWAEYFADKHPDNRIAKYFLGDSYARLTKWDKAIDNYNKAIGDAKSNHHLALNARGVAIAALTKSVSDRHVIEAVLGKISDDFEGDLREWALGKARNDFKEAVDIKQDFADAYASIGALYIQWGTAPLKALGAFDKAIEISPDFVIALNQRGAINAILRYWESAKLDFDKAIQNTEEGCLSKLSESIQINLCYAEYSVAKDIREMLASAAAALEPGMELKTAYEEREVIAKLVKLLPAATQLEVDRSLLQTAQNLIAIAKYMEPIDIEFSKEALIEVKRIEKIRVNILKIEPLPKPKPIEPEPVIGLNGSWRNSFKAVKIIEEISGREALGVDPQGNPLIEAGGWDYVSMYGLLYLVTPEQDS